jgi:hypothetical protein
MTEQEGGSPNHREVMTEVTTTDGTQGNAGIAEPQVEARDQTKRKRRIRETKEEMKRHPRSAVVLFAKGEHIFTPWAKKHTHCSERGAAEYWKEVGNAWKTAPEDTKRKYLNQAAKEREDWSRQHPPSYWKKLLPE